MEEERNKIKGEVAVLIDGESESSLEYTTPTTPLLTSTGDS